MVNTKDLLSGPFSYIAGYCLKMQNLIKLGERGELHDYFGN